MKRINNLTRRTTATLTISLLIATTGAFASWSTCGLPKCWVNDTPNYSVGCDPVPCYTTDGGANWVYGQDALNAAYAFDSGNFGAVFADYQDGGYTYPASGGGAGPASWTLDGVSQKAGIVVNWLTTGTITVSAIALVLTITWGIYLMSRRP